MPVLIVIMGVSGSGKSTIAAALAKQYNYQFVEADDFHPTENINSMRAGIPLTDKMREPWIQALCAHLTNAAKLNQSCILSYSGLRAEHRKRFSKLPFEPLFIQLDGAKEQILKRMNKRQGHFMTSDLLTSQFDSMEPPQTNEEIAFISINQTVNDVINSANQVINDWL